MVLLQESTWLVVIAVMVANMLRMSVNGNWESDDPFGNLALGWVILAVGVVLLVASRRSKNRLLMKAGCADMASLPKALILTQMAEQLKTRSRRVSVQGRRGTLRMLRSAPVQEAAMDLGEVYPCRKPSIFTKVLHSTLFLCYTVHVAHRKL